MRSLAFATPAIAVFGLRNALTLRELRISEVAP